MSAMDPESTTVANRKSADKERDRAAETDRFLKRKAWFMQEMNRQQANRYQMALDEDYYDGDQWLQDEASEIMARGQAPVVFNEIKPVVDYLVGTEARARTDFTVTARDDDSDQAHEEGQAKTKLLKFIDDVNRTQFRRTDAAEECFKAGLGWMEVGIRIDESDFPIYKRSESWRYMLHDSLGQSKMPEDWRYIFRFREVDLDIAEAFVPKAKREALHRSIIRADERRSYMEWWNGNPMTGMSSMTDMALSGRWTSYDADAWLANPRDRVLLIECWSSEVYKDSGDARHTMEDRPFRMRKRFSLMTEHETLIETWSPYKHGQFPFIPLWCYRRKKDGQPYGVIRQLRGPQDSLNKHMSKAQFRIAVRQVHYEASALNREIMDEDELEQRIADPAAALQFADGALSGNKIKLVEGAALAQSDVAMAERMALSIRTMGPVSTEDRGQDPQDVSGKARAIRQEQGSRLTAQVFDNLMLARQIEGEVSLSLAEQYMTSPMTFGLRGEGARPDYTKVNTPDEETGEILNDVTRRKHAFVIGEAPWQQSLAEGAFESAMAMMGELAKVAPNVVIAILDVVFEMHPNLPKRATILKRIRGVTGMEDPDAGPTPEMQAERQRKAQMAQLEFESQMAMIRAQIREAEAKGEKLSAEAMSKKLESLYLAAQAAELLVRAPIIAPMADELAKSVGFQDQAGDGIVNGAVSQPSANPMQMAPQLPAPQPPQQ